MNGNFPNDVFDFVKHAMNKLKTKQKMLQTCVYIRIYFKVILGNRLKIYTEKKTQIY